MRWTLRAVVHGVGHLVRLAVRWIGHSEHRAEDEVPLERLLDLSHELLRRARLLLVGVVYVRHRMGTHLVVVAVGPALLGVEPRGVLPVLPCEHAAQERLQLQAQIPLHAHLARGAEEAVETFEYVHPLVGLIADESRLFVGHLKNGLAEH